MIINIIVINIKNIHFISETRAFTGNLSAEIKLKMKVIELCRNCSVRIQRIERADILQIKNDLKMETMFAADENLGAEEEVATTPSFEVAQIQNEHNYSRRE